jgi:hypothetical protein
MYIFICNYKFFRKDTIAQLRHSLISEVQNRRVLETEFSHYKGQVEGLVIR